MNFTIIQLAVCDHFGIALPDLLKQDRHKAIRYARSLAMHLCRTRLGMSLPAIGRAFGRDHTSVLLACRKMELLMATDQRAMDHRTAIVERLGAEERQQAPSPDYSLHEAVGK